MSVARGTGAVSTTRTRKKLSNGFCFAGFGRRGGRAVVHRRDNAIATRTSCRPRARVAARRADEPLLDAVHRGRPGDQTTTSSRETTGRARHLRGTKQGTDRFPPLSSHRRRSPGEVIDDHSLQTGLAIAHLRFASLPPNPAAERCSRRSTAGADFVGREFLPGGLELLQRHDGTTERRVAHRLAVVAGAHRRREHILRTGLAVSSRQ